MGEILKWTNRGQPIQLCDGIPNRIGGYFPISPVLKCKYIASTSNSICFRFNYGMHSPSALKIMIKLFDTDIQYVSWNMYTFCALFCPLWFSILSECMWPMFPYWCDVTGNVTILPLLRWHWRKLERLGETLRHLCNPRHNDTRTVLDNFVMHAWVHSIDLTYINLWVGSNKCALTSVTHRNNKVQPLHMKVP